MSKIETALRLASEGFHVFPCVPNAKTPAVTAWQEKATTDQSIIRKWWESDNDFNIGIYTGSFNGGEQSLIVVDVDVKDGKPGQKTYKEIRNKLGLNTTRTNITTTKGRHFLYLSNTKVKSSAGLLGEGIDIRSYGGYVIGPSSIIDGIEYTSDWTDLMKAPQSLVDACGKPREKGNVEQAIDDLDTDGAVERTIDWLINGAPEATEHKNGDHDTFTVACRVKDFGISQGLAVDLMYDHWNTAKAFPPWQYADLATKVSNAYQYSVNPLGIANAQADFPEDLSKILPPLTPKQKLYYVKPKDIKTDTDDIHLIEGLLSHNAMTVLYGESNVGKTFAALKFSYCIATGTLFQNRQVEKGAVVYVACESSRSVLDRVVGLKEYYKKSNFDLAVVPCPIDLLNPKNDVDNLINLIADVSSDLGNVKLIVIDTLSRAISGGNENSPDDMGAFVKYIDKIRHSMKAHMMVVHHAGKDTAKGARGHSLLRAATDTELEVVRSTGSYSIRVRKQRDMDAGNDISFQLNVVDIGVNQYGKTITTCVMQEQEVSAAEDFNDLPDLTDREQILMDVLEANEDPDNSLEMDKLRPLLKSHLGFFQGKSHRAFCNAVVTTVTKLVTKGSIKFNKKKQTVTRCVTTVTDDVTVH